MKRRDLLLAIISLGREHSQFGRTSLQKVAYFVALALGFDWGHRAYYYGPFSHAVEQDVEALTLSDLVDETVHSLGFVNRQGFSGRQYSYDVTEAGAERVEAIRAAHAEEYDRVAQVVAQLRERFGGLDQAELSAAAKVVYLTVREGRILDKNQIRQLAGELGWDLGEGAIDRVRSITDLNPAFGGQGR